MAINHRNFSQTTLAAAITDTGGTSITVTSEASFPTAPFIISIDTEAMLVTTVSTTTWTVTRGYEGSTAATHLNGAVIFHDISAAEADSIAAKKTDNVSVTDKVLGRSSAGAGAIEEIDCTAAGRELINDANAAAQRATLGIDYYGLFLAALARHGALTNLITNGEFETDVTGWVGGTITRETGVPLVGTGSLKMVTTATPYAANIATTIIAGHVYYFGGLVKSTAAAGRKVLAQGSKDTGYVNGIAVDCSASAQTISMFWLSDNTNAYPSFVFDAVVAGESFLLDSVVCYDLSV